MNRRNEMFTSENVAYASAEDSIIHEYESIKNLQMPYVPFLSYCQYI